MLDPAVKRLLDEVIGFIGEIDRECSTLLNGVEHGLINVKQEFKTRAFKEIGKRLTEETLIAWLIWQKLRARGWSVDWEVVYPENRRKKCDLVVKVSAKSRLWLELKLASKAWFNCEEKPGYHNSLYPSYLEGKNRTHSFQHDFHKLTQRDENWSVDDYRAVCLIGFDWIKEPMDDEVAAVAKGVQEEAQAWKLISENHWTDRRNADFRINAWCWLFCSSCGPPNGEAEKPAPARTSDISQAMRQT